ncbi:hybrid sensor histidine kinase/response regulator [Citrobacter enshiensis]|uniref:hybrid sensor histidine kinase/response regulator n=1 Tax=Citrobacter enshiensis TaxID=2971264 RepID=UPI0023E839C6|nr:hybrid sensor histidine kinase/response regulator [Citrobacter enshiensis]WET40340.1 ATP-binding protein [Citrobacter enshiensis]
MPQPGRHFFASARGRLLFFNLLVVAVTLMVSGVAVLGFRHASQIQEQVQQQTVDDMTGSMNLARDTANVATAAVRLSQVVGALEYKGEAERLQETQRALKQSLEQLAAAPLAQQEPELVARIIQRSNELQTSVAGMLQRGQRRHLERNALLSSLYQNLSYLRHLQTINAAQDAVLLAQMDRLIVAAIETPTPRSVVKQLDGVMPLLPTRNARPLVNGILSDFNQELHQLEPLSAALEQSDLAIIWHMFHIKALVAILNSDINQYVAQVAASSEQRVAQSHQELQSIIMFIMTFALLAIVITGFAGWYIYRNLGSNLTAISRAMTRLAHGESDVSVPALQRRDELGELARAFNVFARNTASLEHTSRLLKEKSTQLEIDRIERKGLEEALLHSQKMKAVGQLTGGLAHDFNNLLAVIIGSLELVNPDSPDAARISRALKAAERGALLTQRLLAFSRKQSLHPHAVELRTLLENLGELMRHSLPATLTLDIEAQSPAWPAWIDVSQLENALINLVMNARDAMEGQMGTIKIRTWNQRVTRSSGRKEDMVILEIADHGCGMSQEIKAQVFEPFFTTKQTGSGSGLGLSMVYGFVRQSGGRVEIESAPGQGTTVRLQLPRAIVPVATPPEPLAEEAVARTDKLVLVLEDEADVRQTLCEQLHLLGYLTLEAANGEQAMQMLAASTEIDIFISDLMLPGGLSGADVVNHALKHYPHLTLLLISGQDLRPADNPALPDVALLRKPFTRVQLVQALHQAVIKSDSAPANVAIEQQMN